MATLQELSIRQIDEAIQAAVDRQVPATITVRLDPGWETYHSHFVALDQGHICVELPRSPDGRPLHGFAPAEKAGVSFKLKHHKHTFTGTVAGLEARPMPDGQELPIIRICSPTRMHRMQRRAFTRAVVPEGRVVRASFWPGGREAEPSPPSPDRPLWSGRVINLSAGGFQLRMPHDAADQLQPGQIVGVRIWLGAGEEPVYADAQFRHRQAADGDVRLGFQFIGLAQTVDGRRALQAIGSKVGELQRQGESEAHAR